MWGVRKWLFGRRNFRNNSFKLDTTDTSISMSTIILITFAFMHIVMCASSMSKKKKKREIIKWKWEELSIVIIFLWLLRNYEHFWWALVNFSATRPTTRLNVYHKVSKWTGYLKSSGYRLSSGKLVAELYYPGTYPRGSGPTPKNF